jgi:hypothetical protein
VNLTAISFQGLEHAEAGFERSAGRLAAAGLPGPDGALADVADRSTAAVEFLSTRRDVELNLEVLGSANEMERQTLDLLA